MEFQKPSRSGIVVRDEDSIRFRFVFALAHQLRL
jgi:hypothetical protein